MTMKKLCSSRKDEEPFVKMLSALSQEQVEAVKALRLPPPPPPMKRQPISAIEENWGDEKQFGIWIDGERVENEEMKKYQASDFAYHFVSELKENAKNYGKHQATN